MAKKDDSERAANAKERARARAAAARRRAARLSKGHTSGFVEFIRDKGIVALAVGLAIGTVASGTVQTIVQGFVSPVVQFVVGTHKTLEVQVWHLELWGRTADFKWGAALSSLITLTMTIYVIYLLVKIFRLDKLNKPKD